jgi:UDP-3-O-[3-hydroxymyristoyl] glucosamine N-acyltransferase
LFLSELASAIDGKLLGDSNCEVFDIASVVENCNGKLTFVLEKKFIKLALKSKATAFITFQELPFAANQIVVKNPRKALAKTIELIKQPAKTSISLDTKNNYVDISSTAKVDKTATIKSFSVIGDKTIIGKNTEIMTSVTIGANCKIGKNCLIYPGVVIYDYTEIGNNVILQAGCKIGVDGYGYSFDNQKWHKILHIGKVVIKDDVEIGANVCVDRGCLGNTVIGCGTKIDNLTHIAHNTRIGNHCVITGLVAFMGGATVGNNVQIGGQAGVASINIGNKATIAAKAGVTKDVADNSVVSGFPAWDHAKELKKESFIRRLFEKNRHKL